MKPDVKQALDEAARLRRALLQKLSPAQRDTLLEQLLTDFFVTQRNVLLKWSALTGQSAQVDTGYIAQHVASLLLAEPGQGFKGKGLDLMDKSEVKSAAVLAGVDRPRWNHNLGKPANDLARALNGQSPKWQEFIDAPYVFYLLFDRVFADDDTALVLRIRGWCIDSRRDPAWRALFAKFGSARITDQYNFQLHPPVGYPDSLVVNTLGNLDFGPAKVFEVHITGLASAADPTAVHWQQRPQYPIKDHIGPTQALPYGKRGERPSRLSGAADVAPDINLLRELLPDPELQEDIQAVADALAEQAHVLPMIEDQSEARECASDADPVDS